MTAVRLQVSEMSYFICLFCVILSQTVYANVVSYSGQNAVNIEHKAPFLNTIAIGANGAQAANQIATNAAITGNILTNAGANNANANIGNAIKGNANLANANVNRVNAIMENVNPSTANQVRTNLENANLAPSKFADIKLAAQNLANNLDINKRGRTNLQENNADLGYGFSNSLINSNIRPNLSNQLYRSNSANPIGQTNLAKSVFSNNGNSYNNPNTFKPFANNFSMGNPKAGLAGYLPNFGNGNIANDNFAQALATGSLANSITPGATFSIDGNPFKVLSGVQDNQIRLNIMAEALEVGGSVSVAGKMPFSGTVALSGSLPADGIATVNYGCTQHA